MNAFDDGVGKSLGREAVVTAAVSEREVVEHNRMEQVSTGSFAETLQDGWTRAVERRFQVRNRCVGRKDDGDLHV